eukprot:UN21071
MVPVCFSCFGAFVFYPPFKSPVMSLAAVPGIFPNNCLRNLRFFFFFRSVIVKRKFTSRKKHVFS